MFAALACALFVSLAAGAGPNADGTNRFGITVSPQTTVRTEPLTTDGRVDYAAALNGARIAPADNAAALLVRLARRGDDDRDARMAGEAARLLGVDAQGPTVVCEEPADEQIDAWLECMQKPWSAKEHPQLARVLELNRDAMDLFIQASQRASYWYPVVPGPEGGLTSRHLGPLVAIRVAADAVRARAMRELHEKQYVASCRDLNALHNVARQLGASPEFVVQLGGIGMHMRTLDATRSWLIHADASGREFRDFAKLLERVRQDLRVDFRTEHYQFLDSIQQAAVAEFSAHERASDDETRRTRDQASKAGLQVPDWNQIMRMGNGVFFDIRALSEPMPRAE